MKTARVFFLMVGFVFASRAVFAANCFDESRENYRKSLNELRQYYQDTGKK